MSNTKYIVSMAISTTSYLPHCEPTTNCVIEPIVHLDGTGFTKIFDSYMDAVNEMNRAKADLEKSARAEGWEILDDEYEDEDTLTMGVNRGGVQSDRLIRFTVIYLNL
jgi:hypothetical protein